MSVNGTVFSFSPGGNHSHCFDVVIADDDNVLEEDEELMLSLSSNDEGVILTSDVLIIQILDDDGKKLYKIELLGSRPKYRLYRLLYARYPWRLLDKGFVL